MLADLDFESHQPKSCMFHCELLQNSKQLLFHYSMFDAKKIEKCNEEEYEKAKASTYNDFLINMLCKFLIFILSFHGKSVCIEPLH